MKDTAFRQFLEEHYSSKLTPETIAATMSRCNRIERELEVDLDVTNPLNLTEAVDDIHPSKGVRNDLRNALYRYRDFLDYQKG